MAPQYFQDDGHDETPAAPAPRGRLAIAGLILPSAVLLLSLNVAYMSWLGGRLQARVDRLEARVWQLEDRPAPPRVEVLDLGMSIGRRGGAPEPVVAISVDGGRETHWVLSAKGLMGDMARAKAWGPDRP